MTLARDQDRIICAWLTGIARRNASQILSDRGGNEMAAVSELRATAGGRDDLLEEVAASAMASPDQAVSYFVELGQEVARLCLLAVND